jgi:hypothetical protein
MISDRRRSLIYLKALATTSRRLMAAIMQRSKPDMAEILPGFRARTLKPHGSRSGLDISQHAPSEPSPDACLMRLQFTSLVASARDVGPKRARADALGQHEQVKS